jgi:hypothetical protein
VYFNEELPLLIIRIFKFLSGMLICDNEPDTYIMVAHVRIISIEKLLVTKQEIN